MCAATAAAYMDERSIEAFLRKAGKIYPAAAYGRGRGRRWDQRDLDDTRLANGPGQGLSLADDLL